MLETALAVGHAPQGRLPGPDGASGTTDQLPISAKIPQIMLVIDEGAEILVSSDQQMRNSRRRSSK